jgi:hypothetical protein
MTRCLFPFISGLLLMAVPAAVCAQSFVLKTEESQINFSHVNDPLQQREATLVVGGGAVGDYDFDGFPDLYLLGGSDQHNALYHNNGDGTYSEVGQAAGVALFDILGSGPTFADVDGDFDLDLLVFSIQKWDQPVGTDTDVLENRPRLFINQGNGSFVDQSATSGFSSGMPSYSGSFGDFDLDGDLDLFMTHWTSDQETVSKQLFWENNGSGQFTDVTIDYLGLTQNANLEKFTFTPNITDINEDGLPDVLLTSDFGTTRIFYHQGIALGEPSFQQAQPPVITDENGMGAAVADYDNDGDLDWFVTSVWDPDGKPEGNWGVTGNRLYQNTGGGNFQDVTDFAGVRQGYWGWGSCFADFDNDGHLDIYHENGFNNDLLAGEFLNDPARLFMSNGNGTFTEKSAQSGLTFTGQGRGISCLDHDQDGDLDIVIMPNNEAYQLYENTTVNNHHYLQVNVFDSGTNPYAIGGRVNVVSNSFTQMRELSSANNYVSNNPLQQHFGLGNDDQITSLMITWPDGVTHTINSQLPVDQNLSLGRFCHTPFLTRYHTPTPGQPLPLYLHQADGSAISAVNVNAAITQGPNAGWTASDTTDGTGTAEFQVPYSGDGTDRITYEFSVDLNTHQCHGLIRWQNDLIFADGFNP